MISQTKLGSDFVNQAGLGLGLISQTKLGSDFVNQAGLGLGLVSQRGLVPVWSVKLDSFQVLFNCNPE